MWSMPVVLTKWENENDSANQNEIRMKSTGFHECELLRDDQV